MRLRPGKPCFCNTMGGQVCQMTLTSNFLSRSCCGRAWIRCHGRRPLLSSTWNGDCCQRTQASANASASALSSDCISQSHIFNPSDLRASALIM